MRNCTRNSPQAAARIVALVLMADFDTADSIALALHRPRAEHGAQIASVIHLVACFDLDDTDQPLDQATSVEGTRHLLRGVQDFEVERLVYASTMLVHRACRPGPLVGAPRHHAAGLAGPATGGRSECRGAAQRA